MVMAGSVTAAVDDSAAVGASGLSLNVGGNRAGVIASDCGCEDVGSVEVVGPGVDDDVVLTIAAGGRTSISTKSSWLPDCSEAGSGSGGCGG